MAKSIPPFIKWSGSKRKIASKLAEYFPISTNGFDPFAGSCAIIPYMKSQNVFTGDLCNDLIEIWKSLQNNPQEFYMEYSKRWTEMQAHGDEYYYQVRSRFNMQHDPHDFFFLTRTCQNGLIRFNKKGEFNTSINHGRMGIVPKTIEPIINRWAVFVKDVDFIHADYKEVLSKTKDGDFVFLDPPYIEGTDVMYINVPFSIEDFWHELELLNSKNVKWMLTFDNDPPKELFVEKFNIPVGESSFYRLGTNWQDGKKDFFEKVFLNYVI